ncbi:MAG: HAMP domain-containing protein [Deltaproteobacteria bacterium]|nr:HAMP domain-containing protein [Deltaproteobacteria bacterium]
MHKGYISLRSKLALAFATLMVANAIFLYLFFPARADKAARDWARDRATDIALVLASAVRSGLEFDDAGAVERLLSGLDSAKGAIYGAVFRDDGSRLAAWNSEKVAANIQNPGESNTYYFDDANGLLNVTARIIAPDGTRGVLALGFSLERVIQERQANKFTITIVAILLTLLGIIAVVFIGTIIARPVGRLTSVTSEIVNHRDLSMRVAADSNDEVGRLAESFSKLVNWLRSTLNSLNVMVNGMVKVIEHTTQTGQTVTEGAGLIRKQMDGTVQAVSDMRVSLKGLAEDVLLLQSSASQGSVSIIQIARVNDDVAKDVQSMVESVNDTANAMQSMTGAFNDIVNGIEKLNDALLTTSSSMAETDAAIHEVEKIASETARLSEKVSTDAGLGVNALDKTLNGIEEIRSSTNIAAKVIENLGESVSRIGTILKIINEVTDKTNLLALNASIIAAQAGEHGKGFGVVANEIKMLAQRTSVSTTEIATLIKTIQEESQQAQVAMVKGLSSVQEGVQLGKEAGEALANIHHSSQQAKTMARSIARATEEQARATNQVTSAIQRISDTVQQLTAASRSQARSSEEVMNSTSRLKSLTTQVEHSGREQAKGSKQVIDIISTIQGMIEEVGKAQAEQTTASSQVLSAIEATSQAAQNQSRSVSGLENAIESLRRQSDQLKDEMNRFHL